MGKIHFVGEDKKKIELPPERCLANDVIFAHEHNPHKVTLWVIGDETGPLAAVWSSNEDDAFDEAADAELLEGMALEEPEEEEEDDGDDVSRLGNSGDAFDMTYAWIDKLDVSKQPLPTLLAFAEARGAGDDTLET